MVEPKRLLHTRTRPRPPREGHQILLHLPHTSLQPAFRSERVRVLESLRVTMMYVRATRDDRPRRYLLSAEYGTGRGNGTRQAPGRPGYKPQRFLDQGTQVRQLFERGPLDYAVSVGYSLFQLGLELSQHVGICQHAIRGGYERVRRAICSCQQ